MFALEPFEAAYVGPKDAWHLVEFSNPYLSNHPLPVGLVTIAERTAAILFTIPSAEKSSFGVGPGHVKARQS